MAIRESIPFSLAGGERRTGSAKRAATDWITGSTDATVTRPVPERSAPPAAGWPRPERMRSHTTVKACQRFPLWASGGRFFNSGEDHLRLGHHTAEAHILPGLGGDADIHRHHLSALPAGGCQQMGGLKAVKGHCEIRLHRTLGHITAVGIHAAGKSREITAATASLICRQTERNFSDSSPMKAGAEEGHPPQCRQWRDISAPTLHPSHSQKR